MNMQMSLQGFQNYLSDMSQASSKIQAGFSKLYDKESLTTQESTVFTQAFVEEDFAARLAEAQLKVLKTEDEILGTVLDLNASSKEN